MLSKQTVEKKILPALNQKLGCQRTYSQYLSRPKWFKNRYGNFVELLRNSSGFGWDPVNKKFTARDEVWEDYFMSHPNHRYLKNDTFADNEDLKIAIGNGTAVGKNSIALGDETDARTFEVEENRNFGMQELFEVFDIIFKILLARVVSRDPENAVELFNLRHASLRNVIERIFGIFKSRFTIFKSAPPFPYKTQAELVLACVGLHKFLRKECRSDEFPIELDTEFSPSSSLPVNQGDNLEQIFETQEQQRENANEWRIGIASDMWKDVEHNNTNGR